MNSDRASISVNDRVLEYFRTQHAIKIWIEDVLAVPLVGEDLRFGLKSGVILCYLIQEIEPGSVPVIHENTTQVFKLKENVENFIAAVSEYGVPRHKLFAVNDLFEGANIPRVIECLSWLAKIAEDREFHTPISDHIGESEDYNPTLPTGDVLRKLMDQLRQIKEPPKNARRPGTTDQSKRRTGAIKESLELHAPSTPTPSTPSTPTTPSTPSTPSIPTIPFTPTTPTPTTHTPTPTTPTNPATPTSPTHPKEIIKKPTQPANPAVATPPTPTEPTEVPAVKEEAQNLKKLNAGVAKFQAAYRGWCQRKLYKQNRRHASFREKVANELLKTERDYVQSLDACIRNYYKPLNDAVIKVKDAKLSISKDSLSRDQLRAIFSDIQIIFDFNSTLLADISVRVDKWYPSQRIGDIFLKMAGVLKIYSNYVQNFDLALRVLDEVKKKDKKISNFLQETRNVPEVRNLDLASFLVMPVQRIPRYNLLLQELRKHTWKNHPDYTSLSEAITKVSDVAAYINEKKREAETQAKVSEIHSVLRGKYQPLYAAGRRLVREAVFLDHKEGDKYVYLFSDILVWGKPGKRLLGGSTSTVKYKDTIPLETITVTDMPTPTQFSLKSTKTKYTLLLNAKDAEEKQTWMYDIDSSTKSVGKVKLLGIPPNERRKPSKFLLGERSHSRLNRENSRLGAGGMRPVPASPLAASNGVTSAPTTPVSNQAPQTLALPSPLSTLFSPQPGKFTSGIPNKEVMSAPSSPAMSPAASSLLSSSATISPPTSPVLGHPPAPHPPESPMVAHTPASPTLTSIPKPILASPTAAQTPASPTLTSTPKPIPALPTAVQTSSPAIQPKTPTFQATTSQPVTPITTPSSPRATEPASPRGTSATSPPTSDQLGRLNETKLEILKQLKTLDLQPLEKKHPASPPPKEEPKEDRDANGEDGEDRPNKKNQNRKRDVGTIRNMNEQQFRETVRTQLESQLEALETQIKVLQNDHSPAPAQENAAQATSPTQRRLTPPPNVSYESPQPRFSLQPVRAVVKPQEDLPEAIQALMRIKSAGSRESAILLLPTPTSHTHLEEADAAPAAAPASERSPQNRLERMSTSYVQTTSSEKDDVLGYGKMTQRGIRKHINMLDRSKLEAYLSDDEFTRVLGFNRTDYAALPKWKQERLKRERGLL